MKATDQTKSHVISTYVIPARKRGEKTIQIRVGNVQRELGWVNRAPSVFSTLSSKEFQREANVQLIEKVGGPASGGPSTTVKFVYQLLDNPENHAGLSTQAQNGDSLRTLYGICADTFKALGGGEAFLRSEREWGPDVWERYGAEKGQQEQQQGLK